MYPRSDQWPETGDQLLLIQGDYYGGDQKGCGNIEAGEDVCPPESMRCGGVREPPCTDLEVFIGGVPCRDTRRIVSQFIACFPPRRDAVPGAPDADIVVRMKRGNEDVFQESEPVPFSFVKSCPDGQFRIEFTCYFCDRGTYRFEGMPDGACAPCSAVEGLDARMVTEGVGAVTPDECMCPGGMYERSAGKEMRECVRCMPGAACSRIGTRVETIGIEASFWRARPGSQDVRRCPTPELCMGGLPGEYDGDVGYCKANFTGPYCELCKDGHYRDFGLNCAPCSEARYLTYFLPFLVMIACGFVVALAFRTSRRFRKFATTAWRGLGKRRLVSPSTAITAKVAFRCVLSFIQVTLLIEKVFVVALPRNFNVFLEPFRILSFDKIYVYGLSCNGVSYHTTLTYLPLAPVFVTAFVLAVRACAFLPWTWRSSVVLPLLLCTYVLTPTAAATIYGSLNYDKVDSYSGPRSSRYLRADLSVDFDSEKHQSYLTYAYAMMGIYTVLFPVVLHRALRADNTPLAMLTAGYKPSARGWEAIELTRQLLLIGVSVLVRFVVLASSDADSAELGDAGKFASLVQLVLAVLTQMAYTTIFTEVRPLDNRVNQFIVALSHVCLLLVLFGALGLLYSDDVAPEFVSILGGALIGAFGALLLVGCSVIPYQVYLERRQPFPRDAVTRSQIFCADLGSKSAAAIHSAVPASGLAYHAFISHVWSTGQDQARLVKEELLSMMPGVQVFLDVDNLANIDALEDSVYASGVIVFFLSRGFFHSPNVLREVVATIRKKIPFVVMFETDAGKGGMTSREYVDECLHCRDEEVIAAAPLLFGSWFLPPAGSSAASGILPSGLPPLPWYRERSHLEVTMLTLCNRLRHYGALVPGVKSATSLTLVGESEGEYPPTLVLGWITNRAAVEGARSLREAAEGLLHAEYTALVRVDPSNGSVLLDKGLRVRVATGICEWEDEPHANGLDSGEISALAPGVVILKLHPATFGHGMLIDASEIEKLVSARERQGAVGAAAALCERAASTLALDVTNAALRLESLTRSDARVMQLTSFEKVLVHEEGVGGDWPMPLAELAQTLDLNMPFRDRATPLEDVAHGITGRVLLLWPRDTAFEDAIANTVRNTKREVVPCMDADPAVKPIGFYFLRACAPPHFASDSDIMAALFGPIAKPLRGGIHSTASWMDVSSACVQALRSRTGWQSDVKVHMMQMSLPLKKERQAPKTGSSGIPHGHDTTALHAA